MRAITKGKSIYFTAIELRLIRESIAKHKRTGKWDALEQEFNGIIEKITKSQRS